MAKKFWLKQRHNPQLGTYWVKCGQLSVREAKSQERTLYGQNAMHPYALDAFARTTPSPSPANRGIENDSAAPVPILRNATYRRA